MTATVGSIQVVLTATSGGFTTALQNAATATGRSTSEMRRHIDGATASMGGLRRVLNTDLASRWLGGAISQFGDLHTRVQFLHRAIVALSGAFGGLGLAFSVNAIIQYADAYKLLQAQIGTVTKSSADMSAMQEALFESAQRSRAGLRETVTMYARMARASDQLALSQRELIYFAETIQKSFIISGSTTQEAQGAAIQLSQAMASNKLAGEEMRSLLENAPLLAKAIADMLSARTGTTVTIGKLRELGAEGKITALDIIDGVRRSGVAIDAQFNKMPMTVGQSLVLLDNAFIKYVGSQDASLGATKMLSNGIKSLSENLDSVMNAAVMAGAVFLSGAFGRGVAAGTNSVTAFVSGVQRARTESVALARAANENARISLAAAETAALRAGTMVRVLEATPNFNRDPRMFGEVVKARQEQMAANAELLRSQQAAAASAEGLKQAERAATRTGTAFGTVRAVGSSVVGLFGGPLGFALTGVAIALSMGAVSAAKAEVELSKYVSTYQEYLAKQQKGGSQKVVDDPLAAGANELRKKIEESDKALKKFQDSVSAYQQMAKAAPGGGGEVSKMFARVGTDAGAVAAGIARMRTAGQNIPNVMLQIERLAQAALGAAAAVKETRTALEGLGAPATPKQSFRQSEEESGRRLIGANQDWMTEAERHANREVRVAKLRAAGREAEARALQEYFRLLDEGKVVDRKFLESKEQTLQALELSAKLKRLSEEAQGAFLGDLDRSVIQHAREVKASAASIAAYVEAAKTGSFTGIAPQLMEIRQIEMLKAAGTEYRSVLEKYGTWAQIAPQAAQKQNELNLAVQRGAITADQAKQAYADFLGKFESNRWIDRTADAMNEFAASAVTDFDNVGQAAENLRKTLVRIVYDETIGRGLRQMIRGALSGSGGGEFNLGGLFNIFGGGSGAGASSSLYATQSAAAVKMHSGGGPGKSGMPTTIPSYMIPGAPRFHGGLSSREFAAVLEYGEHVLTEGMADRTAGTIAGLSDAVGSGGPVVNHVVNNYSGAPVESTSRQDGGEITIETIIPSLEDQMANRMSRGRGSLGKVAAGQRTGRNLRG